MKKIKFSVLMSVYKNDKTEYVKIALNSILNQTLKPDQYVIMIDGPIDDDLKKLLLKYEKENDIVELHFRKENKGLGITLNEGLNYCKYDYVARMDADDISEINRFEKQIEYMENNIDISVLGCSIAEYDEKMKSIISYREVPKSYSEIKEYIKKRNPLNHPTVIFKKNDILSVGSYEDYPLFEDYYLWAKLVAKGYIINNIDVPLYKFRGGNSMYGRRGGIKYLKNIKKMERGLLDLKIINKFEYWKNIIIRYTGALIPNWLRILIYKILLRKQEEIDYEK